MDIPGTYLFCDGQLLVRAGERQPAPASEALPLLTQTRELLDQFTVQPQGFEAVAVSGPTTEAPDGFEWARVRALLAEESPHAAAACRALGLLNWRSTHRFCGKCGTRLHEHPTEVARQCPDCRHTEYPAISPAIIVRVEKNGRILLARHVQRSQEIYSCIAGYLEVGESAEDGVRREVREEVGLEVTAIRYVGSQYWPYPNQLMLAFTAEWAGGEICPQAAEIADAQWFDPARLPAVPPAGSVAYRLLRGWMA